MGVLGSIHLAHPCLADLFDDLVMADGGADHTIPPTCAVQLPAMLRREAAKDNGNREGWMWNRMVFQQVTNNPMTIPINRQ